MRKIVKRYHPPGTPPGTLLPAAEGAAPARIRLLEYTAERCKEIAVESLDDCLPYLKTPAATWIHIQGAPSPAMLKQLGQKFGLHPLALEDVQNTGQRPKFDPHPEHYFLIAALPRSADNEIHIDQVSIFLGPGFLVTFTSNGEDPFEPIRKRLHAESSLIRGYPVGYLLYAVLDLVIDAGFPVLEKLGEEIEHLEEAVLDSPSRDTVTTIHHLRRNLLVLRRMLWPQRDLVSAILREENNLIDEHTRLYLRDCHDHAIQVMDLLENYRDMITSLMDIYLSSLSYRMNDVMRTLTVIATIFMPLTFIAGLYGMNFGNGNPAASPLAMPELNWYFGYPLALGIMVAVAGAMGLYFRRKGWF
ncbi:MAG: magnesium/cobalt transporter CorA [Gammaproteobacteria bacterium]|nr:magnesium/cobalt transporter CorA [Gammaproteobacteria bacterium]